MNIVVFGLPGSGKTRFASQLSYTIGGLRISSDAIRQQLQEADTYSEQAKMAVYREMLRQMEAAVQHKRCAVLDATFYRAGIRNLFIAKAEALNSELYFIEIKANEAIIRERLNRKRADSDADFNIYLRIKQQFESLTQGHLVLYSDTETPEEMLHRALTYIHYSDGSAGN